ncbi:hypothetical protein Cpap_0958 [Ruminiclostridium papyrosolvens DSM 2782]|uniref:AraC family transcriptional regulator n=1 Tax=Ruminiclostridium papyrosolvens DSM 2782 TaxID=588581 RepID=F1TFV9_9FIRM|nr:hypothetical protein [Ruminiclostridium papyrosolvens]EGD46578.1 hypothetical protein Cpap_0958 [Ruminiclostridium papyrosolvens DSM 2782]WES35729.1 AraC family transcriptional regulator [Ruminiclostridium papyrosolvens DSM 2782]
MSELIKRLSGVKLVGKELRYNMEAHMKGDNRLPAFWDKCFADYTFLLLEEQTNYIYNSSYVGIMLDWDKGDGEFSYVIGMLMKDGVTVPEGYYYKDIEDTRYTIPDENGDIILDYYIPINDK